MKLFNNILITNDDGYDALGLNILKKCLKRFSTNVYVVAPQKNKSASGRSITLRKKINFKQVSDFDWIVDGTPTDAMILALNHVFKDFNPDFVFSGINAGSNVGDEISYSGTVGAAFESALRGIPSAALSQHSENNKLFNFDVAKKNLPNVIKELKKQNFENCFFNVNFPNCNTDEVKEIFFAQSSNQKLSDEIKINYNEMFFEIGKMIIREENKIINDIYALKKNYITFTPIDINLTKR